MPAEQEVEILMVMRPVSSTGSSQQNKGWGIDAV